MTVTFRHMVDVILGLNSTRIERGEQTGQCNVRNHCLGYGQNSKTDEATPI